MKKYLIFFSAVLLLFAFTPKNTVISGTITGENGNPVPFASVMVIGTNTGVQADANGHYVLKVNERAKRLQFSAVAFETKIEEIGNRTVINVTLKNAVNTLQEVVVTGAFGIKKQARSVTVANGLAGSVSGVVIRESTSNSWFADEGDFNTEEYSPIAENQFHRVSSDPLSTFSIDVDAASYSNVRRYLNSGHLPPAGAVRTEEFINYFKYGYPQPAGSDPFSINTEIADCPWNRSHKIALVGLQGKNIPTEKLPPSNLVFLIDVSGSMMDENKLPLVKKSISLLVDQLREHDLVSMVVYAGNAGLVLAPTAGSQKSVIKNAINALEAGGSTAGGEGIRLAYKTAAENFKPNGNNRVILCTDGDFNVGESSDDAMVGLIEKEREKGIFLSVLGYGMGNYKDSKMQQLADKGNGNHSYIDGINEAKKVLVNEFGGTLFTIAKDVKLQVEFNPAMVAGYRLIGYENRVMNKEDFNNDKKDAGELGSGHTVTALYEIIPAGVSSPYLQPVDKLKYDRNEEEEESRITASADWFTVKFRYKEPAGAKSKLLEQAVNLKSKAFAEASENLRFASMAAAFAMLLRNSEFLQGYGFASIINNARNAIGTDTEGYRKEFIALAETADNIRSSQANK
ncbi:MAG: von Willebrand factor type A domain-containing protein [Ferruginibacter sp.]